MGKVIPMINKWTKQAIMFDVLIALDNFNKTGNREGFKEWQKKWEKELDLINDINIKQLKAEK